MDPVSSIDEPLGSNGNTKSIRPRASAWLWCPWYAKLWWTAAAIFWSGKLASYWSVELSDLYTTALAGILNVAFFPPVLLLVLGVRFIQPWMDYHGWEWGEPTHEQMFPKRSVGGLTDPYSDPLDPRSGMLHWKHFHPDN